MVGLTSHLTVTLLAVLEAFNNFFYYFEIFLILRRKISQFATEEGSYKTTLIEDGLRDNRDANLSIITSKFLNLTD